MKYLLRFISTILAFYLAAGQAGAQTLDSATIKKIDAVFKPWDNKTSPGCVVGIVRNDSVIYAKGYGMANLEYGIPLTTKSVFEMGSVSKQFTAYAIFLLAHEGKLRLDDDIHKYLPWMPDFEKKITISNLLYHTSGIRDYDQLLAIAGTTQKDVIKREHVLKLLSRQKTLNFDPGLQYMYSNSGYFLLGEIVRSVTGKSLRQFTDSVIFKPLGMTNTHFHDDYTEVVANKAYPYMAKDKMGIVNSSAVGAKGLQTDVDDMCKWAMNFYNSKSESYPVIQQMMISGKLNSGKETGVGAGLQTGQFATFKTWFHPGNNNGYYNLVTYIPQAKMAFIIFSNTGDHDIFGEADGLAGLFIKDTRPVSEQTSFKIRGDSIIKDTASAKALLGAYTVQDGDHTEFKLKDRKFYYVYYGTSYLLLRTARDSFVFPGFSTGIRFAFNRNDKGHITVRQTWPAGYGRTMKKNDESNHPNDKKLMTYAGRYYCPELDCSYNVILKDHQLVLTNSKYADSPITIYDKTRLLNTLDWMRTLIFTRDKNGKITGFEVNHELIQDLRFDKVK